MDSRNEFIDTELFINAVENENAIWNTQTPEYSLRNEKSKAWENISKLFYENFDDKPIAEKNNLVYLVSTLYINYTN